MDNNTMMQYFEWYLAADQKQKNGYGKEECRGGMHRLSRKLQGECDYRGRRLGCISCSGGFGIGLGGMRR